jgi:hypothetical protein
MKIGGVDPTILTKEVILVLPRGDEQVVFRAVGLSNYDEFNALCPEPKPPGKLTATGWEPNQEDKDYQSVLAAHNARRMAYMAVTSLAPSEIEWDTVVMGKPSTWQNWEVDMKKNGFSQVECNRVMGLVMEANCLDEERLQQAREVFLLGQQPVPSEFSGPSTEPETSPSGEPASE